MRLNRMTNQQSKKMPRSGLLPTATAAMAADENAQIKNRQLLISAT